MSVVATRERPIIFTGESVRAILAGEKTQSRRVMEPQPPEGQWVDRCYYGKTGWALWGPPDEHGRSGCNCYSKIRCPYGQPGDRLWAKESAYIAPLNFGTEDTAHPTDIKIDRVGCKRIVTYSASMSADAKRCAQEYGVRQTSSRFLPRWASRLTLELIEVRVERLQDITEEDARAEGLVPLDGMFYSAAICLRAKAMGESFEDSRPTFSLLWDHINGKKPGCTWADSPWVWCLSFRRMEEQG